MPDALATETLGNRFRTNIAVPGTPDPVDDTALSELEAVVEEPSS